MTNLEITYRTITTEMAEISNRWQNLEAQALAAREQMRAEGYDEDAIADMNAPAAVEIRALQAQILQLGKTADTIKAKINCDED